MPTALFALGPIAATGDPARRVGRSRRRSPSSSGSPVTTEMFGGKYDPRVVRGLDKMVTKLKASPTHGLPACDGRDRDFIDRWLARSQTHWDSRTRPRSTQASPDESRHVLGRRRWDGASRRT